MYAKPVLYVLTLDLDVRLNKADDRRLSHLGARTGPARHAQSRRQFLTWQVCQRLLLTCQFVLPALCSLSCCDTLAYRAAPNLYQVDALIWGLKN